MKMPSIKTLLISIISAVLLTIGLAYWFISDVNTNLVEEKGQEEASGEKSKEEIDPERYIDDGGNSTEDNDIPSENRFMNILHGMTHQKVYADDKWTLVEMTDERIEEMLVTLDQVKDQGTYEHYDLYYTALTEWKNGDFENAVDVHNQIWSMNSGTVGRATRLLSTEEESAFVEEHY